MLVISANQWFIWILMLESRRKWHKCASRDKSKAHTIVCTSRQSVDHKDTPEDAPDPQIVCQVSTHLPCRFGGNTPRALLARRYLP